MNKIKRVVFALIFAVVHFDWLEFVEAFKVITTPTVTWVDADSSPLPTHHELMTPAPLVASDAALGESPVWPPPWLRATTTEWPQQLPAVIWGVGGRAMKS